MKYRNLWLIVALILAGLQLSACGQPPKAGIAAGEPPARITPIPGTDLHYVVLSEQAAKRVDIQMDAVREEQVTRKWIIGGIVGPPTPFPATITRRPGPGGTWVRVPLSVDDLNRVDQTQSVRVLPLTGEAAGVTAQPAGATTDKAKAELYYVVDSADHGLVKDARVRVELTLAGGGTQHKVVPYPAVVFDVRGATWVYTTQEPRTFVRHAVSVDYVEGDLAVLSDGPPAGTMVVTVGTAELAGAEFGVGH